MSHASDGALVSWGTLALLGAFHGLNPGMGWLFAVALGMQEGRAAAVWRALLPLGLGHAGAIALAILSGVLLGFAMPTGMLRWPIAVVLIVFGASRLVRHRHPRWGGMRIGMGGLTIWSFLVATAHGAGLMVLPVWLAMSAPAAAAAHPSAAPAGLLPCHTPVGADIATGLTATAIHGLSYLLVTTAIAWVVYARVGVASLRRAWINLDLIWAFALIVSGALTLVLGHA